MKCYYHISIRLKSGKRHLISDLRRVRAFVLCDHFKRQKDLFDNGLRIPYSEVDQLIVGRTPAPAIEYQDVLNRKWQSDLENMNDSHLTVLFPPYQLAELDRYAEMVTDRFVANRLVNTVLSLIFARPWWALIPVVVVAVTIIRSCN
jgi:hypothetical protein